MAENKQEIEFTFRYEIDDYKKAYLSNYYRNKLVIFALILFPVLFIALFCYIIFNSTPIDITYDDFLIIMLAGAFIFVSLSRPIMIVSQIKHRWVTSMQYNDTEFKVIINNDEIYFENDLGEQRYNWNIIYLVVEQKEAFCFYLNSQEYRVFPKRVLSTEQINTLRYIIFKNIGSKYSIQGLNKKKVLESELS